MIALHRGDCLEVMATLPEGSVDLILCDLPYGTTACKWDSVIPFELLWKNYWRVLRPCGAAVLTAHQPFTAALLMSQPKAFRHSWIWVKSNVSNFANAKIAPLRTFEDVLVFARRSPTYNPQGLRSVDWPRRRGLDDVAFMRGAIAREYRQRQTGYPKNVLHFKSERGLHPTQKPVTLMEYLIRTYSRPGETVLDNCMGSGTTGVACVNTGRSFIGIERDPDYFRIAKRRIAAAERAAQSEAV